MQKRQAGKYYFGAAALSLVAGAVALFFYQKNSAEASTSAASRPAAKVEAAKFDPAVVEKSVTLTH